MIWYVLGLISYSNIAGRCSRFHDSFCDVVLHPATLFCIFAQGTDFLEISALAGQDAQGQKDFKDWLIENIGCVFLMVFSLIFPTASAIALLVTEWSPVSTRFTIQVGDVRGWCSQWRNCHWHRHCQRPRGSLTSFPFKYIWNLLRSHLCFCVCLPSFCEAVQDSSVFLIFSHHSIAHHASLPGDVHWHGCNYQRSVQMCGR